MASICKPLEAGKAGRRRASVLALLLHAILLASIPPICAGEFQILQDTNVGPPAAATSYAPSDVPSTSPSVPNQASAGDVPSAVPSISYTYQPTTIPICPNEWTQYRSCFQNEMPTSGAYDCDMCVGASMPGRDTTCDQYSESICDAITTTCDCAPCQDDIELYFRCTYAELGLDCPLDCGTIAAPTSAPTTVAPTAAPPNASNASAVNSTSDNATTPTGSTSGAVARFSGHGRPELALLAGAAIVGAAQWL